MAKRRAASSWAGIFNRNVATLARLGVRAGALALGRAPAPFGVSPKPARRAGDWLSGTAVGPAGALRYRLFRPAGARFGERLPLLVMLHGCGQDAKSFAASTRMNVVAARERFLVLYPEQDRRSNLKGCWNWFDTTSGRAYGEAGLIMAAIGQVATLVQVTQLGHAWSGGANDQDFSDGDGPDASRMVWGFAARQFASSIRG